MKMYLVKAILPREKRAKTLRFRNYYCVAIDDQEAKEKVRANMREMRTDPAIRLHVSEVEAGVAMGLIGSVSSDSYLLRPEKQTFEGAP